MSWFSSKRTTPEVVEAPAPPPRFVCRTCGNSQTFYVAQQVTNWNTISQPWRTPSGSLTYRQYNSFIPGEDGPPLAYSCGNCHTQAKALEDLVEEPPAA